MRADRFLYSDVGVRQNLLNLLMCYDSAYMKLALETVYRQILVFSLGTEEASLSKFIEKVRIVARLSVFSQAACPVR